MHACMQAQQPRPPSMEIALESCATAMVMVQSVCTLHIRRVWGACPVSARLSEVLTNEYSFIGLLLKEGLDWDWTGTGLGLEHFSFYHLLSGPGSGDKL
jgi:hypothetical protein